MHLDFGITFLAVSAGWIISELMLLFFRRSDASRKSRDSGSLLLLNAVIYGSTSLAILFGFSGIGRIPGAGSGLAWSGLALIILGLALRWSAILTLRQYFTVNVAIHSHQRIVQNGLYSLIRHPAYLGSIISFLGLGLALINWIALLLLLIPVVSAFVRRMDVEERALAQEFGSHYKDYCRATWRLIPWLY